MRKSKILLSAAITSASLLSFASVHFEDFDEKKSSTPSHTSPNLKALEEEKLLDHEETQEAAKAKAKKKAKKKSLLQKWRGEKRRTKRIQSLEQRLIQNAPIKEIIQITECAATLIEKHYAGQASILAGIATLQEMKKAYSLEQAAPATIFTKQKEACYRKLDNYKLQKQKKDIRRVKHLNMEEMQDLNSIIENTFPGQYKLQAQIKDSLQSEIHCHNPKGFSLAIVPGIGGYGGMFRQSCKTALGRRYYFYSLKGGVALGAGGQLSQSGTGTNYTKHQIRTDDSTSKKVQLNATAGAAVGIGADTDFDMPITGPIRESTVDADGQSKSKSKAQNRTSFGSVGLGVFAGLGPTFEYKERRPSDFSDLLLNLGIIK